MSKRKPYRFFLYLLLEIGRRIILILPRSLCYIVVTGIGLFVYRVLTKEQNKTIQNLTIAFGCEKDRAEIKRIASRVFVNLSKTAVDVLQFPKLRQRVVDLVLCDNLAEKMSPIYQRGKGFIGLTGHIGNWELLAAYFQNSGYPGRVVGRRIYYEPFNRVLIALRKSVGISTIYRIGALREIFKELRENHWIGMLVDQDIASLDGIFVPFFGREAWTPTAPAKIAIATGAAILPLFMIRESGSRYRLFIEDPILPNGDSEDEVRSITELWSRVVENYVRRYPDQWVWMHNRWKTRPEMVLYKEKVGERVN